MRTKGFTVVELLVVLSIMFIVGMLVYLCLYFCTDMGNPSTTVIIDGREKVIDFYSWKTVWQSGVHLVEMPDGHDYLVAGNVIGIAVVHSAECRKCKATPEQAPPPP